MNLRVFIKSNTGQNSNNLHYNYKLLQQLINQYNNCLYFTNVFGNNESEAQ